MSDLFLPAIACLAGLLLASGLFVLTGRWRPARHHPANLAMLALCALSALVALVFLASGAPAGHLSVPLGLPGLGSTLALDGLSGFFLLLVMLVGTAAAAAALGSRGQYDRTAALLPVFVGGMALALLADDGFTLVLGFEVMSLASLILVLTSPDAEGVRPAALLYAGMAALGAVSLMAALGVLGAGVPGWGLGFAALRAHPPEGARAAVVLALVLVGAGSKAGLAPLHVWLPPAHAAAPGPASALMSGAMTKVALYVILRLLFDLCGPVQPMWWGIPLLLLGGAGGVLGALRATQEADIKSVLACSTIENIGLIAIGLGMALAARAVDLSALAALALGAALLHAMAHAVFKALLFIGAGATQHAAGSRRLDRLGGLIHGMPILTGCMLVGAACLAGLPPLSGFAGEWSLFQALLAGARVGGLGFQALTCVAAAVMALAVALAAAAAVRLIGVAYLGRPRSPRAAGSEEPGWWLLGALIGLAGVCGAIGLLPGGVLGLAGPAVALLTGTAAPAGLLTVSPQAELPGYAPLAVAVLLGLAAAGVVVLRRRHAPGGYRTGPAWDCGFGAPPPWFPFGDPATQYGGASFAQPLHRALGQSLLGAQSVVDMPEPGDTRPATLRVTQHDPAQLAIFDRVAVWRDWLSGRADRMQFLTIRRTLSVMFAVLVLFLVLLAALEQT